MSNVAFNERRNEVVAVVVPLLHTQCDLQIWQHEMYQHHINPLNIHTGTMKQIRARKCIKRAQVGRVN